MDIKSLTTAKDNHDRVHAKQQEKVVTPGKTDGKAGKTGDNSDRITLSPAGLDRAGAENAAIQTKKLILADIGTARLSIGDMDADRAMALLQ